MTYTIEKVTTLIGARRYGCREAQIRWLLTDSRSLCFPEETLFFALKTKRNDGHRYIDDLYRRGVRNFVVEVVPAQADERYPQTNFLKVVDTLAALQRLAERHRDEFDIPIVGITGSNGKTMVKCGPLTQELQLTDRRSLVGVAAERGVACRTLRSGYQ